MDNSPMSDDPNESLEAVVKGTTSSLFQSFNQQIDNLFSPTTKHLGKYLEHRIKRIFVIREKAGKKLIDRGVTETRPVSEKLMVQIMENGSIDEDETMTERWANLLASAADPNHKTTILTSFPEILKQLTPQEVAILEKAYGVPIDSRAAQPLSDWQKMNVPILDNFGDATSDFFIVAIDNLKRLDLLRTLPAGSGVDLIPHSILLTRLGFAFVSACRPPGTTDSTLVVRNYTPEILLKVKDPVVGIPYKVGGAE